MAIECSTRKGSVAAGRCTAGESTPEILEEAFPDGLVHGREAMPRLKSLLERAAIPRSDIDLVAVDLGPGSYTGIRVGVATAAMLAHALGARTVGLSSLDVLAYGAPGATARIAALLDIKRGQLAVGIYERQANGSLTRGDLRATRIEEVPDGLPGGCLLVGDGAALLEERGLVPGSCQVFCDAHAAVPRARILLERALVLDRAGLAGSPLDLRPIYLRPSEAELALERKKRLERDEKR